MTKETPQDRNEADGGANLTAGLEAWAALPHDLKNATSRAVFVAWHVNLNVDMTTRCERVAAAVLAVRAAHCEGDSQ